MGESANVRLNFGTTKGVVEGAYELASAGECTSLTEIKKKLFQRGHLRGEIEDHFLGIAFRRQIDLMMAKARTKATD